MKMLCLPVKIQDSLCLHELLELRAVVDLMNSCGGGEELPEV